MFHWTLLAKGFFTTPKGERCRAKSRGTSIQDHYGMISITILPLARVKLLHPSTRQCLFCVSLSTCSASWIGKCWDNLVKKCKSESTWGFIMVWNMADIPVQWETKAPVASYFHSRTSQQTMIKLYCYRVSAALSLRRLQVEVHKGIVRPSKASNEKTAAIQQVICVYLHCSGHDITPSFTCVWSRFLDPSATAKSQCFDEALHPLHDQLCRKIYVNTFMNLHHNASQHICTTCIILHWHARLSLSQCAAGLVHCVSKQCIALQGVLFGHVITGKGEQAQVWSNLHWAFGTRQQRMHLSQVICDMMITTPTSLAWRWWSGISLLCNSKVVPAVVTCMTQGSSNRIEELVGGNAFHQNHSVTGPEHIMALDIKHRTQGAKQIAVRSSTWNQHCLSTIHRYWTAWSNLELEGHDLIDDHSHASQSATLKQAPRVFLWQSRSRLCVRALHDWSWCIGSWR